ncbi:Histone-lysine N-methyltransferase MEDEA [Cercospora beticola]|uniref:Histone-lysine N-methyltransferase MEDEA n=1 Tax=Cercospora beticola TaxID=122368 RepID=A0A2G5I7Z1_CERBT|nr:Histone-lysine N-methyltransferase MEDEA [Cercospora beticola]PIB00927.1 Histone-lysine N-methyltransferase MEDEA [Cercospora beticola]WPA96179.1 hypothetical protein RHO25_000785 [Cercospora beticola]
MSAVVDLCSSSDDDDDTPQRTYSSKHPSQNTVARPVPKPVAPMKPGPNNKAVSHPHRDRDSTLRDPKSSARLHSATAAKGRSEDVNRLKDNKISSSASTFPSGSGSSARAGHTTASGFQIPQFPGSLSSPQRAESRVLADSQKRAQKRPYDDNRALPTAWQHEPQKKRKTTSVPQASVNTPPSKAASGSVAVRNGSSTGTARSDPIDLTGGDEGPKPRNVLNSRHASGKIADSSPLAAQATRNAPAKAVKDRSPFLNKAPTAATTSARPASSLKNSGTAASLEILGRDVFTLKANPGRNSSQPVSSPTKSELSRTQLGQPFASSIGPDSSGQRERRSTVPESPPLSPEAILESRISPPAQSSHSGRAGLPSSLTSPKVRSVHTESDISREKRDTQRTSVTSTSFQHNKEGTDAGPLNGISSPRKLQEQPQSAPVIAERGPGQPTNDFLTRAGHGVSGAEKASQKRDTDAQAKQDRAPGTAVKSHKASTVAKPTSLQPGVSTILAAPPTNSAPVPSNVPQVHGIEKLVGQYVEEMRDDNEHWTRLELQRARAKFPPRSRESRRASSVFKKLKPIPLLPLAKKGIPAGCAKFTIELHTSTSRSPKASYVVKRTAYSTSGTVDVPRYSHYVSIRQNQLAHNVTTLQHWPYFGDDFDMDEAYSLKREFNIDVDERERKLLRLGQAENFGPYAEDLIRSIGCEWSDVLTFLLQVAPAVGESDEARKALRDRALLASEDCTRNEDRWKKVLTKLPPADPDKVGKAAVLCDHFQRMAKFSFWHIVRRTAFMRELVTRSEYHENDDQLTCRVCMRYRCPFHGAIEGQPSGSEHGSDPDNTVVETDIILPQAVNFRRRVEFPSTIDSEPATIDKRRTLEYWEKGPFGNLKWKADDRGPFFPCHHPGIPCSDARCSCYNERVACEKTCSCGPGCKRKWKGCACQSSTRSNPKAKLVCWDDDRCVCFQKSRECDPDLCGPCGVADVLDPVHRHDDRILEGRCRMASIQRGIAKHTILGDSGVHGLGLYACEDMSRGDFAGEYKGETITKPEAERRGAVYFHQKLSYLFSLNNAQEIDSTYFGCKTRFINHVGGTLANLSPRIIMVNTVFRIGMFANRLIKAGEELLFDYGPSFPKDQLGVESAKSTLAVKSAPRVRNAGLVRDNFYDVSLTKDQDGNIRATKKATDMGDSDEDENRSDTSPRRYRLPQRSRSATHARQVGASVVPGRPRKAAVAPIEEAFESGDAFAAEGVNAKDQGDDEDVRMDAQRRLSMYNLLENNGAEDEDFEPEEDSESEMDLANSDGD